MYREEDLINLYVVFRSKIKIENDFAERILLRGNFYFSYIKRNPFPFFPQYYKETIIEYSKTTIVDGIEEYHNPKITEIVFTYDFLKEEYERLKGKENFSLLPFEIFLLLTSELNSKSIITKKTIPFIPLNEHFNNPKLTVVPITNLERILKQ